MKITKATAKGHRTYQEDRYVVFPTVLGTYLGVFDGHGGDECAVVCTEQLPTVLSSKPDLWDALAELNENTQRLHSGSTASLVFIPADNQETLQGKTMLHVAVLGDSPVIAKLADGSLWVSPEHNIRTNDAESDAAIARGGFVNGGYLFASYSGQGLQMSRALGDRDLDKVLSREPEVFSHVLGKDSWVLVCTDGAVDPGHGAPKTNIAAIVRMIEEEDADAQDIVDRALAVPTRDNVTAILVRL